MKSLLQAASFLVLFSTSLRGQSAVLFGQRWRVQRYDLFQDVRFDDPKHPGTLIGLLDAESATCTAPDRLVIASRQMDLAPNQSYENFVVEVRVESDASGAVIGVSYGRTILVNDARTPPAGLGSAFDLDPKGVTINTGASGIGASGGLLVGEGQQIVRAYALASGALLSTGFSCDPPNDDLEDCAFVPDAAGSGGRVFTIDQSAPPRIEVFGTLGTWLTGFGVGTAAAPPAPSGDPKGLAWLPDVATFPLLFRGQGGVLLVALDDGGPGLQAFTRNGALIAYEPLSAPAFQPGSQVLNIEGVAADPLLGRIFLVQQGANGANDFLWVLSPDCDANGIADALDIASGLALDANGDAIPDACEVPGSAFCFGDGTGTPCPCGNASAFGSNAGCISSIGQGGVLGAVGIARLSFDTLLLEGSSMPDSSALYFQGTMQQGGGLGSPFGDGLRCAGGATIRLGVRTNAGGRSQYPSFGDVAISVRGLVAAPGVRTYQCWYRNAAAFCMPSTFNLTGGFEATWAP